ncbi:hypothetical protein PV10_05873 [Exophiala mesophila]|uniref:BTB domain-containing protein n=1 Tax=Exophiala mesophila TaxID=212818 RepID=A0A0D1Z9B7_EXOME|nr:uncharacterized protein PV10_05873 [Exophiala mesophila]KIV91322.1 hypothetical protein PV10_05873 [Exophiala mesophila]
MTTDGVLRKDQLERSLHDEKKLIEQGILREDNPLDFSEDFQKLCDACRQGDLKVCQQMIQAGANINAKDQYDYTPLILASLCGHYETVQLLLESGALCERDTFQGERCLYNALNDRIRNLLLSYDYSKSTDPLQPLASHLISLISRQHPKTYDLEVITPTDVFRLHKYILSARSPYFQKKLIDAPDTTIWKLPATIPSPSFAIALKHLYLGDLPRDMGGGPGTGFTDLEILAGVDRISKHLEISKLSDLILESGDRRLARQRRQDEVEMGRDQLETWFRNNVLRHAIETDTARANEVRWDRDNGIFADILLRADEDEDDDEQDDESQSLDRRRTHTTATSALGIPFSSSSNTSKTPSRATSPSPSELRKPRRSKLFPVHKAQLIRSEFFLTMFSSNFLEAQNTPHLHIIPIDCSPRVLEVILTFLYTERADFGLDIAVDVLFAADMLFLEKVKAKAAVVISTLGNGTATGMSNNANPMANPTPSPQPGEETTTTTTTTTTITTDSSSPEGPSNTTLTTKEGVEGEGSEDLIDIYLILRAAWLTRVQRLEEFAARYIAYRLETYIDEPEFMDLVAESASRIEKRQETDSIELIDDIRYYLSERFRLRFEDVGMEEMEMDQQGQEEAQAHLIQTELGLATAAAPNGFDLKEDDGLGANKELTTEDVTNPLIHQHYPTGAVRTLDGELAGDEFDADAINYQLLLGKIDTLLEKLKLDA